MFFFSFIDFIEDPWVSFLIFVQYMVGCLNIVCPQEVLPVLPKFAGKEVHSIRAPSKIEIIAATKLMV